MKKLFFILFTLSLFTNSFSQAIKTINSLDSFFAGVPLQKSYEEWVLYAGTNFSIDSSAEKRVYSSLKTGSKNHFPFPDSIPVRIILSTGVKNVPSAKITDTVKSIFIQGIFRKGKANKKNIYTCFNQLKSLLKTYYKKTILHTADSVNFFEGINENFPDTFLIIGYFKKEDYYSIVLSYRNDNWVKY